jgi:hypothetical protein
MAAWAEEGRAGSVPSPTDLAQGGAGQSNLAESRPPLLNEPFKPPNSGTFIAPTICLPHEQG